jgi:hypothetical protein
MNGFNKKARLQWIAISELEVHWPEAQRKLSELKAKGIAKAFDADLFGTITVSPLPGGKYHVSDGWTRTTAARMIFGENEKVPCNVVPAETEQRAAEIFHDINGNRTRPSALEMFRSAVTANRPEETVANTICTEVGLRVDGHSADGSIRACKALVLILRHHGPEILREALLTIQAFWGKDHWAYDGNIMQGVALFLAVNGDTPIDKAKLAKKVVKRFTPGHLLGSARANAEAFGRSMPRTISALMQECHNPSHLQARKEA